MGSTARWTTLSAWIKVIVIALLSINWFLLENYLSCFGVEGDEDFFRKLFLAVAGCGGVGTFTTLLILRFIGKTRDEIEAAFGLLWGVLDIFAGAWILVFLAPLSTQTPLDEMIRDGRVQFSSGMNFLFAGMLLLADALSYMSKYL